MSVTYPADQSDITNWKPVTVRHAPGVKPYVPCSWPPNQSSVVSQVKSTIPDSGLVGWAIHRLQSKDVFTEAITDESYVVLTARRDDNGNPFLINLESQKELEKFMRIRTVKGKQYMGYFARSWRLIIHRGKIVGTNHLDINKADFEVKIQGGVAHVKENL